MYGSKAARSDRAQASGKRRVLGSFLERSFVITDLRRARHELERRGQIVLSPQMHQGLLSLFHKVGL